MSREHPETRSRSACTTRVAASPPELRERVFERFAMLDGSRSGTGGTGLGLAIAQESAHLIGGRLRVVDDGPGCTFELVAPSTLAARTGVEDGGRAGPAGA